MLAGFGVFFCKGGNLEYELQVCCLMAGPQLCILDLFPFVGYQEAQEILRLLIQIFAGLDNISVSWISFIWLVMRKLEKYYGCESRSFVSNSIHLEVNLVLL